MLNLREVAASALSDLVTTLLTKLDICMLIVLADTPIVTEVDDVGAPEKITSTGQDSGAHMPLEQPVEDLTKSAVSAQTIASESGCLLLLSLSLSLSPLSLSLSPLSLSLLSLSLFLSLSLSLFVFIFSLSLCVCVRVCVCRCLRLCSSILVS